MKTKEDIELHELSYGSKQYPSVNIRIHHFPTIDDIVENFCCAEDQAINVSRAAYESVQEIFFNDYVPEIVEKHFGSGTKYYITGRSGGWITVTTLDDIASWDAIKLMKWYRFEKEVQDLVKQLTSKENVFEEIELNQWVME